ncbi:MAG: hypothetical protein ACLPSH_09895 [Vulcanimicrobiaceae bacterium]
MAALLVLLGIADGADPGVAAPPLPPVPVVTFALAAESAAATLEQRFYTGRGMWRHRVPEVGCSRGNVDWGDDSLTYALALRWKTTADPSVPPILRALGSTARSYRTCELATCREWSDVPLWDSVADVLEYQIGAEAGALAKAKAAFALVDASNAYALGACPRVDYQQPGGGTTELKTLETDANYVRAALALFAATRRPTYLIKAVRKYAAVRAYFLDPHVPLYTVYLFDDGNACAQLPHRFFASVNGSMILSGLALARATGDAAYRTQALATARMVAAKLSDPSGVYADLQAENDVSEPLVEAMYDVAAVQHQAFARRWLTTAARARSAFTGAVPGRFFDGPDPRAPVTEWQANGALALAFAAAALEPGATLLPSAWAKASYVEHDLSRLPATLAFRGSAIALLGTLGERCCESGHARVFVDATETFDRTGIWQNKSSSGKSFPHTVLFVWRWPSSGRHTLRFEPGRPNPKEGASFLHLTGYEFVP